MRVVVTGAGGFIGSRLADALLRPDSPIKVTSLLLTDTVLPTKSTTTDPRVINLPLDICGDNAAEKLFENGCDVFFHLAAVVSGHAEADLEIGLKVNFDATRKLLDECRKTPRTRFVFVSTSAVFGGSLPDVVGELTRCAPQSSYGTQKAMCELLLNDYSRRGLVDGVGVRLPTVTVRPGAANRAVTSFVSGIVREPLAGETAICPVPGDIAVWVCSPGTVVKNIIHAGIVSSAKVAEGGWRIVSLPGMKVTVQEIIEALKSVAGERVASRIVHERDDLITRMVASFPAEIDDSRALGLGFVANKNFEDNIREYIKDDLKGTYVK